MLRKEERQTGSCVNVKRKSEHHKRSLLADTNKIRLRTGEAAGKKGDVQKSRGKRTGGYYKNQACPLEPRRPKWAKTGMATRTDKDWQNKKISTTIHFVHNKQTSQAQRGQRGGEIESRL